jgi:patatin-like phospholipase/acyl hydrolase
MRILAIDGGGIRGLIPALVLAELERRTGRRVADLFDLVAGTSTGGILAAALCRPDPLAAEDAARLYLEEGPRIFERRLLREVSSGVGTLDERYPRASLSDALRRYLHGYRLSEARPGLLITSYDLEGRQAFFFRTSRARQDAAYDFPLVEVCEATSAAPTYFEPAVVTDVAGSASYALVDGGVFANNPAMCALADVSRAGRAPDVTLLLSLGTGALTRRLDRQAACG